MKHTLPSMRRHLMILPILVAIITMVVFRDIDHVEDPNYLAFLVLDVGAMAVSSICMVVLLVDNRYRIKSRCCVWILALMLLCFMTDTCGVYFWKESPEPSLVFLFFNLDYLLATITVTVMVYALKHFINPDLHKHRIYTDICLVLTGLEAFLLLQNVFTHNLWYMDGNMIVHGGLYFMMFLAPLTENILYIIACLHLSKNKWLGLLFASMLLFSVIGVCLMLPGYYSSVHYLLTLFPSLVIIPYMYYHRGDRLIHVVSELDTKQYSQSVSKLVPEDLTKLFDDLLIQDFISEDVSEALEKLKTYVLSNIISIKDAPVIPVSKELEHLEAFLYLEKLRYKERLNVFYDLQYVDFVVPPLTLQILAENAVKHGIAKRPEGGNLWIHSEQTFSGYKIVVRDDGVGFDVSAPLNTERTHVGLTNLKERIHNNLHGTIDVQSVPGEGTVVTIMIPLSTV